MTGYISELVITLFTFSSLLDVSAQSNLITTPAQVFSICDKVNKEDLLTDNFPRELPASLPLGISKTIAGSKYIIAIDNVIFFDIKATCSAYMAIDLPGALDRIAFAAGSISINPKGVISSNNSRLMLVSEHHIKINQNVMLILKADGSNYVEWDCNGFKSVNLKGYFEFSNSILIPDSTAAGSSTVTASFEIHTDDIHNFIAQVNITPFTLKGLKDVSFSVTNATVDLSEISSAPAMIYPAGYQLNGDVNQWTGFYLRNVTVTLPKELSKKNQARTLLFATNLIIDGSGISGTFGGTNLLASENSDMSGWQFSINKLSASIVQNHLNGGGIAGTLKLPLFDNNALVYDAAFEENLSTKQLDYRFIVGAQNNLQANVLSAAIDLYPTSKIIISKVNSKFYPQADLTGQIKFNSNAAKTGKLDFQNVIISAEAPYLNSGIFAFTSATADDNRVGKFPITINKIAININQSAPAVYFQVGINFMKSEDKGFSADAGFTVATKFVKDNNGDVSAAPKWKFDKVQISDVVLDIRTQAFTLNGYVIFRENDPIYGNGFSGGIDLGLKTLNLQVKINCIFGATDDYKYFYVDGAVALPTPVVIGTGVALYRFMGGFYYHMKQPDGNAGNLYTSAFNSNGPPNYIPDNSIGLGLKAGVTIGMVGKEDAFNADVALEVQFNSPEAGGGLSLIKFTGDCFLMTSINDRKGKTYSQVPVGALIEIKYDFNKAVFHAVMDVSVNYDGVQGQVTSVLHIDPKDWYINIGTPSNRGYITIYDVATLTSYFMVGNKIEPMPAFPSQITEAFDIPNNRDDVALQSAKGFAFGAELSASAETTFGVDFFSVSGNVNLLIGFDVMLQKYPPNFRCPNTRTNPGLKGWFVKGDLYAYFDASVRIKGKYKKAWSFDETIFSGSATALLYGELPKPSYVEGHFKCDYNVLGGLVKGDFNFDFKKGTRCEG